MVYTKAGNDATRRYVKSHQKRIEVKFKKTEYEEVIEPAITKSGMPVAAYIKTAIYEKIEREK